MLTEAVLTWPSLATIILTILAFFGQISIGIPGWQPWMWIAVGSVLEVIYLVVTMGDPAVRDRALNRMLQDRYDPRDIRNYSARQKLQKALEYKKVIDEFVGKQSGAMRVALQDTATEIEDWIALIYRLARSIDTFKSNTIIERDRRAVPTELAAMERRLKQETDPGVRAELQKAIDIRKALVGDLQRVSSLLKRTEIKMDTTVAQLSNVHAKLQLIDAKELDSGRAQRLQAEIREEITSLEDIVSAMDDVYSYSGLETAVSNLSDRADSQELRDLPQAQDDAQARRAGGSQ
jgi:hypothetical protein